MKFEWNENKNLENIKNHGISFEKAVKALMMIWQFRSKMPNTATKPKHAML